MKKLRAFFQKLLGEEPPAQPVDVDQLRLTFKDRYQQFRLLLNANNKALEVMSEIEAALNGVAPFGMQFVRSRCTRVSTNVFQIVQHINALAPNKYAVLFERFKEIQRSINPFVHPPVKAASGPLTLPLSEIDKTAVDLVGPKMAGLGDLARELDLSIPDGFVITSAGFELFMRATDLQAEINQRIQSAQADRPDQLLELSAGIQQLIIQTPLPEALETAIAREVDRLERRSGGSVTLAVRSSALGEDLAQTSFAGQYRSVLNVGRENLAAAYKEVLASKYGVPAVTYRLNRGIRDEDVPMCAGCLQMVDAVCGGVLYTRNPMAIRDDHLIVSSAWGLPKSVVDGSTATDQFMIARGEPMRIMHRDIPHKTRQYRCYPQEGVCRMEVTGERAALPSLTDAQALALGRIGARIEAHYRAAQDIEWAIDPRERIVLLQCRPLHPAAQSLDRRVVAEDSRPVLLRGGITASAGAAAGPVFVVEKDADALQFPEGAVLVTSQALPRWATLLGRAAAVITEKGSLAGHLANVAREFHVPAIFGVEGALALLPRGEDVTVDASACSIYAGRIAELLEQQSAPRNLMAGSRVWDLLHGAAEFIVPLHLLDPDAIDFKAEKCRTFHDITRFCHEKAVHEMFRFGKTHHFPERSSKQLSSKVPMQWWVLNLDDGFRHEVQGRLVELDNIVSIPMLALWTGIRAFPWQGPPPMDSKGFMSVMFQATTNKALLPTVKSSMANRNYFMISKNYCSLQSRLGFHFSIVETLVSERAGDNYINFHFKGGGADYSRRQQRIFFVRDILEKHGFRVTVREDALTARMEHQDMPDILKSLMVLGYITIHTRQLDMIMANPAMTEYYRRKMDAEIDSMLDSQTSIEPETARSHES